MKLFNINYNTNSHLVSYRYYVIIGLFLCNCSVFSQSETIIDHFIKDYTFYLDSGKVIQGNSLVLKTNNKLLIEKQDYVFRSDKNEITILKMISGQVDTLFISYKTYNIKKNIQLYSFPKEFKQNHSLVFRDTTKSLLKRNKVTNITTNGIFFRGFRLTSNQQLTLESGMNLRLDGELGNQIKLSAVLTDEKAPIQPEGTTRYLSDIDKLFIKLNAPYGNASLGDFNFERNSDPLFNYNNRLQGFIINQTGRNISTSASFSSARGTKHRYRFITKESLQGPYQLLGKNLERDILILAGSERVYLDNKKLIRGEKNDYVMEYGNATLTFSSKNHIKSNSEVIVEFEYVSSTQRFGKEVQRYNMAYKGNTSSLNIQFINEEDNINTPLAEKNSYTEDEIAILKNAGDDFSLTETSTISQNILGYYIKEFNTIFNDSILVYAPESSETKYHVNFTFVGDNKGNYKRVSRFQNEYVFTGKNTGNFSPVKQLFLPKNHNVIVAKSSFEIIKNHTVLLKFASSTIDKNRLSEHDDSDNVGTYTQLNYIFKLPSSSGVDVLSDFKYSKQQLLFDYIQPFSTTQFVSDWGLTNNPEFGDRIDIQEDLKLDFNNGFSIKSILNTVSEGDSISGEKLENTISYDKLKTQVKIHSLVLNSENSYIERKSDYTLIKLDASSKFGKFKPTVSSKFILRNYYETQLNSYKEYSNKIGVNYAENKKNSISYSTELNHLFLGDSVSNEFSSFYATNKSSFSSQLTHKLQFKFKTGSFKDDISISIRETNVKPFFENLESEKRTSYFSSRYINPEFEDSKSLLFKHKLNFTPASKGVSLQLNYELANEQSALKETVYRSVPIGFGQFRRDSINNVYVKDDVAGNLIQFVLPTGEFEPVTKINSSLNFKLNPSKLNLDELNKFRMNSQMKLSEETRDSYRVGHLFLLPSRFFTKNSRQSRFIFQNNIFYNRGNNKFSSTYKYRHSSNLTRLFVSNSEGKNRRRLENTHNLKSVFKLTDEVKGIHVVEIKRLNISSENIFYNRNISGYKLSQLINYKFKQNSHISAKLSYQYDEDFADKKIALNLLGFETSANLLFNESMFFNTRFSVNKVELKSGDKSEFIPYELVNGKRPGINKQWSISGNYEIMENTSLSLNYTGRKDVTDPETFHLGRIEFRMVF